jgi:hypothetical protein
MYVSRKHKGRKRKSRPDYYTKDFHHLLFQGRHWQQGYARLLRQHPYMGKYIPQATLHREIHSKIHDIPTPNGAECRMAYNEICRLEELGLIDIENDSVEKRLDLLIELWAEKCPATVEILKWQRDIVAKFYGGKC